jgi:hypothetical protein
MHYRQRQIHVEGISAAYDGLGPEANPYTPNTNFHRYWATGHSCVKQSQTPVNHTYAVGDHVRPRGLNITNLDKNLIVAEIIDVPQDMIVFDPGLHEDFNDTGVGHHQWLIFIGKGNPVSGRLVELDPDRTIDGPQSTGATDGAE